MMSDIASARTKPLLWVAAAAVAVVAVVAVVAIVAAVSCCRWLR